MIDAGGDPQPDSFSCEAELGYRFFLDRLPRPEDRRVPQPYSG